jgi:hypothetical protein
MAFKLYLGLIYPKKPSRARGVDGATNEGEKVIYIIGLYQEFAVRFRRPGRAVGCRADARDRQRPAESRAGRENKFQNM